MRKSHKWLPERVYRGTSGYEYHPKSGGSKTIAPLTASRREVLKAYENLFAEIGTVGALWKKYTSAERFLNLKPNTQRDYQGAWNALEPVFGKVEARTIKPVHIRKYMDLRSSRKRANTERILLMNILSYGVEYNYLDSNPAKDVKPFPEKPRDRYVTDDEYKAFYDEAPEVVQIFMEIAYICGARGQDIRRLRLSDITDKGLLVVQQKTGKKQVKLWNNRLREVVNKALALRSTRLEKMAHESVFLIVTKGGTPYTADGFKSLWAKARKGKDLGWTFHDLKAKGISDFEGDKQEFSGHKSRLMMERYNRTPDETPVIDFPLGKR